MAWWLFNSIQFEFSLLNLTTLEVFKCFLMDFHIAVLISFVDNYSIVGIIITMSGYRRGFIRNRTTTTTIEKLLYLFIKISDIAFHYVVLIVQLSNPTAEIIWYHDVPNPMFIWYSHVHKQRTLEIIDMIKFLVFFPYLCNLYLISLLSFQASKW